MRVAVVGSGHSGIACAKALVRRGLAVTLFDAGETLSPDRQDMVDSLASLPRHAWDPALVDRITENPTVRLKVPRKLAFGSDFVYGRSRWHSPFDCESTGIAPTYARGGYSTVWGGAIMPTAAEDLGDWPLGRRELEPYYRKVLADIPVSGEPGRLDEPFPPFVANLETLPLPLQARKLLTNLEKAAGALARRNITFGRSRLAVRGLDSGAHRGCISCGLCMSGCPLGSIYKAEADLQSLIRVGGLEYRSGAILRSFRETPQGVHAEFVDDATRSGFSVTIDYLFVATGAISTTRVLLESLKLYDTDVTLKDSQKFLVPMLNLAATPTALDDVAPTLPAVFLEAKPPASPDHYVHVQISAVSDLVMRSLGIHRANRKSLKGRVLAPALKRLMICFGGLHSDYSSKFTLRLRPSNGEDPGSLILRPVINPATAPVVRSVVRSLFVAGLHFRSLVLVPALRIGAPGDGNHYGGSFPMRVAPQSPFETDQLGRPLGHRRVSVVDSTVFPSVPATTPALTLMANAYRIASEVTLDGSA